MKTGRRVFKSCGLLFIGLGFVWACAFDDTFRAYLNAQFWLPFAKRAPHLERPGVARVNAPFAGMFPAAGDSALTKLRAAYQRISQPMQAAFDVTPLRDAVGRARGDRSLTGRERDEVELIDAKIDMRCGQPGDPALLHSAQKKLEAFPRTARTPEFLSEARGWLAYVHFLLGNQTAAGKIYLDELNRNGSNLSREALLVSLKINYGYDGGPELLAHLEEYFDTAEHAAFAIQLVTNPHWHRREDRFERGVNAGEPFGKVKGLLERHRDLLRTNSGANALALLAMRTALRMGDLGEARKIAEAVPAGSTVRAEPDFQWMLASAYFLSREYGRAERPLLALFESPMTSNSQKAAAAYGLCGVYEKSGNRVEQLRFAAWLHYSEHLKGGYMQYPTVINDMSVYWAVSGWDLNMLLEADAPIAAMETFLEKYGSPTAFRLVKYSLAVRLTRENRYEEAARIYESIHAVRRTPRIRRLAALYEEANRAGASEAERLEARYRMAEHLNANADGIYFNDALWGRFQRYVFTASDDVRLTRAEREAMMAGERKLKDDQEERWRAYLILRGVMQDGGDTEMGRKAAGLALSCLRGISADRFGRNEEIRKGDIELTARLRKKG